MQERGSRGSRHGVPPRKNSWRSNVVMAWVLLALGPLPRQLAADAAERDGAHGPIADKIFFNATFILSFAPIKGSLEPLTVGALPKASTLVVLGERVVYQGSLEDAKQLHQGESTQMVDLLGRFVIPGLIDSHVHFIDGGMQLARLSLKGVRSPQEFRARVDRAVASLEPGQWLIGDGWNEAKWVLDAGADVSSAQGSMQADVSNSGSNGVGSATPASAGVPSEPSKTVAEAQCENVGSAKDPEARQCRGAMPEAKGPLSPHKSWIDDVTPHNPVLLTRVDGHVALANSAALRMAGVDASTPLPPGGNVGLDPDGALTGLLQESAIGLVSRLVPPPSVEQRRDGLRRAMEEALRNGVTAVVDLGRYYPGGSGESSWDDLEAVHLPAAEADELKVRVHAVMPLLSWQRLESLIGSRGQQGSSFLRWGLLKAFSDGSIGSRTALLHEPYSDAATAGLQLLDADWLANVTADVILSPARMGVAVHAIGDKAVDIVLSAYERALEAATPSESCRAPASETGNGEMESSSAPGACLYKGPPMDPFLRIEHSQHISEDAPARFQKLGALPSMQPYHLVDDVGVLELALGEERTRKSSYRFRTLQDSSPALALGSDWPVVTISPFEGALAGAHKAAKLIDWRHLDKSQGLSLLQALHGYTGGAARAAMWEQDVGSLGVGRLADMVVLEGDPLVSLEAGDVPTVAAVYVGGVLSYASSPG